MVSLFCRHNRFTADCPICSRGTVLDSPGSGSGSRRPAQRSGAGGTRAATESGRGDDGTTRPRRGSASRGAVTYRGPYASAGPYERQGEAYEVRLERVPGGLRLAEWTGGALSPTAPVLAAGDVAPLIEAAADSRALEPPEHAALAGALVDAAPDPAALDPSPGGGASGHGASPGRSGELREELRVERLDGDRLRVARWVLRPGTGWDLLDAPTMLSAHRYAEAFADAARQGLLAG